MRLTTRGKAVLVIAWLIIAWHLAEILPFWWVIG